jgi:hypothetical protein
MSFHVISCHFMSYHILVCVLGLFPTDIQKVGREGSGVRG